MRLRPRTYSGETDEADVEGELMHFENISQINGTSTDT